MNTFVVPSGISLKFRGLSLPRNCKTISGTKSREFLFEKFHGAGNSSNFSGRDASCVLRNTHNAMRNAQCAFTFVELLISITLVSLVGVAVYSVLANGIHAWRRGNENRAYARNIRLTTERMACDLRNTFEFSDIAFEGTEDSIMFPGLVLSESDSSSSEVESYYELGRIAYFYDSGENALRKEEKIYPQALGEEEIGKGEVLLERVNKLEFNYCYLDNATGNYKWKDDWKKEEQESIPQAVKIEMVLEKGTHQEDFEKTIFVPIGTGEQKIELGSVTEEVKAE